MGPDDMHQKLLDAVATFDDQEHVLFLVDLWGGTPFNQISRILEEEGKQDDRHIVVETAAARDVLEQASAAAD